MPAKKYHSVPLALVVVLCEKTKKKKVLYSLCIGGSRARDDTRRMYRLLVRRTWPVSRSRGCVCAGHVTRAFTVRSTSARLGNGYGRNVCSYFGGPFTKPLTSPKGTTRMSLSHSQYVPVPGTVFRFCHDFLSAAAAA